MVQQRIFDNAEFRELWVAGTPLSDLATKYGVTPETVRANARRFKYPMDSRPEGGRTVITDKDLFTSLWTSDMPAGEVAEKFNVTVRAVHCYASRHGIKRKKEKQPEKKPEIRASDVPAVPGSPFWTRERDERIFMSNGSLSTLSEIAASLGVPTSNVMARWHKLRAAA